VNSWQQLLLIQMTQGRYLNLSRRPVTQYDWWTLWTLIGETHPEWLDLSRRVLTA